MFLFQKQIVSYLNEDIKFMDKFKGKNLTFDDLSKEDQEAITKIGHTSILFSIITILTGLLEVILVIIGFFKFNIVFMFIGSLLYGLRLFTKNRLLHFILRFIKIIFLGMLLFSPII